MTEAKVESILKRYPKTGWRDLYPFLPKRFLCTQGLSEGISAQAPEMSYVDEGRGTPVIMIHGNPTWSFFFRNLILFLSKSHRCLVPDLIGCGLSDKPLIYPYTLSQHVANVEQWLENILPAPDEVNGPIDLVLHDWGGAIGMGYATRHPERIRRIVVMNTAAWPSLIVPKRILLCRAVGFGALLVRGLNLFVRLASTQTVVNPLSEAARTGYLAPYDTWNERVAVLRFVQDIPLSAQQESYIELSRIEKGMSALKDKPLLWQWGARDWCFTPYYRDGWQKRFPAATGDTYEDAGHYVLEDAGEKIIPTIGEFLS